MHSGQTPLDFALHPAGGHRDTGLGIPNLPSSRADDIDRFLQEQHRFTQPEHTLHAAAAAAAAAPQVSSIGGTHFVDFSYAYATATPPALPGDGAGGNPRGRHAHAQPDPYGRAAGGAEARPVRGSTGGFPPAAHPREDSVDGSDATSPESPRGRRAASMGEAYGGDEYEPPRGAGGEGSDAGGGKATDAKGGGGRTPPWSELKTKAGKERKRLPLACIACRRKKIRCSGEKPACKHCLKSRIPCVYRVTTRKAAPRTDYMAMLDKRLKRMEERIIRIVPREEQDPTAVTRAQVRPTRPTSASPAVRPWAGRKRVAAEAFGEELDAWARSHSKPKTPAPRGTSQHQQEAEESRLLSEGVDALPPPDLREHLAEVFFDHLYGQSYHLLHKPSFMRKLRAGTIPPVLMLSVCAVSARFSTHPQLSTQPAFLRGEDWAAPAREIVLKRYDWPNITILTCLLLLAQHEFGTCYGGRSWALGGMAIRMAYTLQLHKDLDHDPLSRGAKAKLSFIDREIRRRTMWACFLMDRFTSSGSNRPMFVKEETIQAQLPIREKFFQLDIEGPTEDLRGNVPHPAAPDTGQVSDPRDNMGVAAYSIRAISLWGRIVIYLFQSGRELEGAPIWDARAKFAGLAQEADEFLRRLPPALAYTLENLRAHETEGLATQYLFLHMAAQQNILFLNHVAAHGNQSGKLPQEAPREFVARASAKAYEASKRISEILKDGEAQPVNTPFGGYCAFWSSSVQMPAVFSKSAAIEVEAKRNLATNVRYLSKMKRYWGAFYWTSQHLKEQYKSCADAARQGPGRHDAAPTTVPSIYHYSDWFDRYPHGVSENDFEDPSTRVKKEVGDDAVLQQRNDYHTVQQFFSTLSPPPPRQEREAPRKVPAPLHIVPQLLADETSLDPGPAAPLVDSSSSSSNNHQIAPPYHPLSQEDANLYYFDPQPSFQPPHPPPPPPPPGLLGIDRPLDVGGFAADPDLMAFNGAHVLDPTGWDMNVGNMMGWMEDPSNGWFVPFNSGPSGMGPDADAFNSLGGGGGGGGVNYGMEGMPLGNLGTGHLMDGPPHDGPPR